MNTRKLFDFLRDLDKNNHKAWMDENRDRYHEVKGEFIDFLDKINNRLTETYPDYTSTPGKTAIERINNNLMYHPEKPTYKDHFGATLDKVKKGSDFYVKIGINGCMVGGGMWHPDREELKNIRAAIDYDGEKLQKIIDKKSFKNTFGDIYRGDSLKTSPQNYSADHPHIDLLRLKSFVIMKDLTQKEVAASDFENKLIEWYGEVQPFFQYLRRAIGVGG